VESFQSNESAKCGVQGLMSSATAIYFHAGHPAWNRSLAMRALKYARRDEASYGFNSLIL
jgi:hypothetical protein